MVKADLLYQLNLRLQELKENTEPFGNICVLLLGDLMQIQPVRARWVFDRPYSQNFSKSYDLNSLWHLFAPIELTINHRQGEDKIYAEILNRIRFGNQTSEDIALLQSRIHPCPPLEYLHVLGNNSLVNEHNMRMLNQTEGNLITIKAQHIHPTLTNYKPTLNEHGQVKKTSFKNVLYLKKKAKIMLVHNVNTSDLLTNGTLGTIIDFVYNTNQTVRYILIDFHNPEVGKHQRQKFRSISDKYTPIPIVSFSYSLSRPSTGIASCHAKVIQFPIKLAWGITTHKIQGQTVPKPKNMVADLNSVFGPGQAYVILSRIQSLQQLHLLSISAGNIKINLAALEETTAMKLRSLNLTIPPWSQNQEGCIKILTLNIRSLKKHLHDLTSNHLLMKGDIICLTETHLNPDQILQIPNYTTLLASIGPGKGVAIYVHEKYQIQNHKTVITPQYQILSIKVANIYVSCIYRSNSIISTFDDIFQFLNENMDLNLPNFIAGDFNYSPENKLLNNLKQFNFQQLIKFPTHVHGNILDHIYTNIQEIQYFIHSVHFTDHDALLSIIKI
jgi:hypothetical protein